MSEQNSAIDALIGQARIAAPAYEHNGRVVSREAFYAVACDPQRSVAVEACAGAGKTWMLVSRILRALLDGARPHEILAITFTKKAAGEMRQRLHEWLKEFSEASDEKLVTELVARGISASDAVRLRVSLKGLYMQVLQAGRPVQIRTFHSWFAALLGAAPVALLQDRGLPVHFELLEDEAEAIQEVWRPFMQRLVEDGDLRADYNSLILQYGRSQTHKALESALKKRVEFELADSAEVIASSVPPFGEVFPELAGQGNPLQGLASDAFRTRWHAYSKALGSETNKTPVKAAAAIVEALELEDPREQLQGLRKALFVAKEDRLATNLQKFEPAQHAEPELQTLLAAQRQHEGHQYQMKMANLMRHLVVDYAAVKSKHGWIDMSDVERMAQTMLGDPVLGGWVQERLDARVSHLLIDEFQDTSPLQWQALGGWLGSYAGSGGGSGAPSVFIVGDPKQSIYRFRRAEPQVFLAAQRFVREGLVGDLLSCDHTRRNAQAVIAAVNHALNDAQNAGEIQGYRSHTTESPLRGTVERLPFLNRLEAATAGAGLVWRDSLTQARHEPEETMRMRECTQAAGWVQGKIAAGVPASKIMVISRKRDRLTAMQEALRDLHIPSIQPEKADLYSTSEVQDVVALMDALVSTGNDLALARALKSPLFGRTDDDLVSVALHCRAAETRTSWFDALGSMSGGVGDIATVLRNYRDLLQTLPPHDALHRIYVHADVVARYVAAVPPQRRQAVQANLRALLAATLDHSGGRFSNAYDFIRSIKKGGVKAPGQVDAGAVRLLTVHGAKGLEADCVLLLNTEPAAQRSETMGVLVDWPGEDAAPRTFAFLTSESAPPPSAVAALEVEKQARQREEINSLYVALTRARDCLALSAVETRGAVSGSWWARVHSLLDDVQPTAHLRVGATAAPGAADMAAVVKDLPAVLFQIERLPAYAGAAEQSSVAARTGEAMHLLLEQLDSQERVTHARDHGWSMARVTALARQFDLSLSAARRAAEMAQNVVKGEGAWAWSCDEHLGDQAMNEVTIQHAGLTLRIDRLVYLAQDRGAIAAGWWVIDYKSATSPETQPLLLEQLDMYKQAVAGQADGKPVRAAFFTGAGTMVQC